MLYAILVVEFIVYAIKQRKKNNNELKKDSINGLIALWWALKNVNGTVKTWIIKK